jgi:TLD
MLFFIPSSGGKNKIVTTLICQRGPFWALVVCVCIVSVWIIIFDSSFKHRFVMNKLRTSNSDGFLDREKSSDNLAGLNASEALLSALSFDVPGDGSSASIKDDPPEEPIDVKPAERSRSSLDLTSPIRRSVAGGSSATLGGLTTPELSRRIHVQSSEPSLIITPEQMETISRWLPIHSTGSCWSLRYSMRRDGASLSTLMALTGSDRSHHRPMHSSCVMIIEDSWGYIFGGYIAHPVENKANYYGNGESFVFSVAPTPACFKWTEENSYFVMSNHHIFAMGGGGEGYAFQLDDELGTRT